MNCQALFQNLFKLNQVPVRACSIREKGIKYYGFTYYPSPDNDSSRQSCRNVDQSEDFKDPPYEPSKLFLVTRIKSVKGVTPREKSCLRLLNIDGKVRFNGHVNIVKNIPQINCLLWTVKHLVEIKPITHKNELPKDGDYTGTYLRPTGELLISPSLKVSSEQIKTSENFHNDKNQLRRKYIRDYLKKKWLHGFSGDV